MDTVCASLELEVDRKPAALDGLFTKKTFWRKLDDEIVECLPVSSPVTLCSLRMLNPWEKDLGELLYKPFCSIVNSQSMPKLVVHWVCRRRQQTDPPHG
jgi:hypothetical protein